MAYGLKIRDSAGNVTMDTTDDTLFQIEASTVSVPGNSSVPVTVSNVLTGNSVRVAAPSDVEGGAKAAYLNSSQVNVINNKSTTETITIIVWARGDGV